MFLYRAVSAVAGGAMAAAFPNLSLICLADASHSAHFEQAQEFNSAVAAFLAG